MDLKLKRPNVPDGYRVIWPLALLFAVLLLLFPRNAKFSYDYRKGSQWHHENLVAQFDFPILKTEEQLREERSRTNTSTVPYYRFRQDVVDNMVKGASEADLGGYPSLLPVVLASLEGIYETGVVPDEGVKLDKGEKDVSGAVMYVQKDKRAVKKPVTEVFLESEAKAKLLADVTARSRSHVNVDSLLRNAGIYDFIAPNLEYDAKTTELVKSESGQQVSTTQGFVSAGELIVSSGEMVTSEVAQMLADPLQRGAHVLQLLTHRHLRGQPVADVEHQKAPGGDILAVDLVQLLVAVHPAAAVDIDHHGQFAVVVGGVVGIQQVQPVAVRQIGEVVFLGNALRQVLRCVVGVVLLLRHAPEFVKDFE